MVYNCTLIVMIIDLRGEKGNAFYLLELANHLAKQCEIDEIEVRNEMRRKDYEHLLLTMRKYFPFVDFIHPHHFEEGDDYWTIEDGQVVWSCWDEISEELHEEFPNRIYYASEMEAKLALKEI